MYFYKSHLHSFRCCTKHVHLYIYIHTYMNMKIRSSKQRHADDNNKQRKAGDRVTGRRMRVDLESRPKNQSWGMCNKIWEA